MCLWRLELGPAAAGRPGACEVDSQSLIVVRYEVLEGMLDQNHGAVSKTM